MNKKQALVLKTYSQEGDTDDKVLNHYIYKMSTAANKDKADRGLSGALF